MEGHNRPHHSIRRARPGGQPGFLAGWQKDSWFVCPTKERFIRFSVCVCFCLSLSHSVCVCMCVCVSVSVYVCLCGAPRSRLRRAWPRALSRRRAAPWLGRYRALPRWGFDKSCCVVQHRKVLRHTAARGHPGWWCKMGREDRRVLDEAAAGLGNSGVCCRGCLRAKKSV